MTGISANELKDQFKSSFRRKRKYCVLTICLIKRKGLKYYIPAKIKKEIRRMIWLLRHDPNRLFLKKMVSYMITRAIIKSFQKIYPIACCFIVGLCRFIAASFPKCKKIFLTQY